MPEETKIDTYIKGQGLEDEYQAWRAEKAIKSRNADGTYNPFLDGLLEVELKRTGNWDEYLIRQAFELDFSTNLEASRGQNPLSTLLDIDSPQPAATTRVAGTEGDPSAPLPFQIPSPLKFISPPDISLSTINDPAKFQNVAELPFAPQSTGVVFSRAERPSDLMTVLDGFVSGVSGIDLGEEVVGLGGTTKNTANEPLYKLGEFIGFGSLISPVSAGTKVVTKGFAAAVELRPVAIRVLNSILTGGTTATIRETGKVLGSAEKTESGFKFSESFDLENIAEEALIFGTIDAITLGAVKFFRNEVKALIKEGKFEDAARAYLKETGITATDKTVVELTAQLRKKNLYGATVSDIAPKIAEDLRHSRIVNDWKAKPENPTVTFPKVVESQMKALKEITPIKGQNRTLTAGGVLETPIHTMERLGADVKEIFIAPERIARHKATVDAIVLEDAFKEVVKENLAGKSPLGIIGIQKGYKKASHRIGLFSIAQQENGLETLAAMGKKVPELTKGELAVYDFMESELKKRFTELNLVRVENGFKKIGEVKNYFPFFRKLDDAIREGVNPITMKNAKGTAFRFEKTRVQSKKELLTDSFQIFRRYNESAFRHKHMTPVVAMNNQLISATLDDGTKKGFRLKKAFPREAEIIQEWNNYIAGQNPVLRISGLSRESARKVEIGLNKLNSNIAYAILSYNLRSIVVQPVAMVNAVTLIRPKYMMIGINSLFNSKIGKMILEKSTVLSSRQFEAAQAEFQEGVKAGLGSLQRQVGKAGFAPLKFFDMYTAKAVWYGSYRRALDKLKLNEKQAITYADDIVTKTQGSGARADRAPIQRTALGRSATNLQTFVIGEWNLLTRDVLGMGNVDVGNKEAFKRVISFIAGAQATNIFFEDVMGTFSPMPDPLRAYKQELRKSGDVGFAGLAALKEFAEIVPIIGGTVKYGNAPVVAETTFELFKHLFLIEGQKRPLLEVLGRFTGVPGTSQIKKTIGAINQEAGR